MTTGGGDGEIQTEIVKAALLRGRMCESVGDVVRTSGTGTSRPEGRCSC